jgi:hypothetical protein
VSAWWLLLLPSAALAQASVDVGLQVGTATLNGVTGGSGGFAGPVAGVTLGAVIFRVRWFQIGVDDRTIIVNEVAKHRSDRDRRLTFVEGIYQFRRASAVRPLVGLSIGSRRDRMTLSCEPAPCPSGSGPVGASTFTHGTTGLILGMAFQPLSRVRIDAVLEAHTFPSEEGQTTEGAVIVNVAVWRRR